MKKTRRIHKDYIIRSLPAMLDYKETVSIDDHEALVEEIKGSNKNKPIVRLGKIMRIATRKCKEHDTVAVFVKVPYTQYNDTYTDRMLKDVKTRYWGTIKSPVDRQTDLVITK